MDEIQKSTYDIEKAKQTVRILSRWETLRGMKAVDVGCGPGYFLNELRPQGVEVYGIDISARCAEFARRAFGIEVWTGSFPEDFQLPRIRVNVAAFNDSIEHFESPFQALRTIHDWLCEHGCLLVRTPNLGYDAVTSGLQDWRLLQPQDHLFFFSADTLERLVHSAGFSVRELLADEWLTLVAEKK